MKEVTELHIKLEGMSAELHSVRSGAEETVSMLQTMLAEKEVQLEEVRETSKLDVAKELESTTKKLECTTQNLEQAWSGTKEVQIQLQAALDTVEATLEDRDSAKEQAALALQQLNENKRAHEEELKRAEDLLMETLQESANNLAENQALKVELQQLTAKVNKMKKQVEDGWVVVNDDEEAA